MNNTVTVSVVMPVYNAKRYLKWSVESILHQAFEDFEFVIVDDGSTDSSLKKLKKFEKLDQRIKVLDRPNRGIVDALNEGIDVSRGKYIARMDADDIALPDRLSKQVTYMQSEQECVILGTQIYFIDPGGNIVKKSELKLRHDEIEQDILDGNGGAIIHPTAMIVREALIKIGGYRKEAEFVEDLDLFHRLARVGKLSNLDEYLFKYRVQPNSVTYGREVERIEILNRIMKEAYEIRSIPFEPKKIISIKSKSERLINDHRDWAITSFEFGSNLVPLKHAIAACLLEPLSRYSWKCLSYVVKRIFRII